MYLSSFSHLLFFVFFFNDTATTEIYTLSLHDALPISEQQLFDLGVKASRAGWVQENFITDDTEQIAAEAGEAANTDRKSTRLNSSHGYISYAVFCLKKKKKTKQDYSNDRPKHKS